MSQGVATVFRPPQDVKGFVFDAQTLVSFGKDLLLVPGALEFLQAAVGRFGQKTAICAPRVVSKEVGLSFEGVETKIPLFCEDSDWPSLDRREKTELVLGLASDYLGLPPGNLGYITSFPHPLLCALTAGYQSVVLLASSAMADIWESKIPDLISSHLASTNGEAERLGGAEELAERVTVVRSFDSICF